MLFSILVPVYNVEEYLPQCLDSLLAQKCKDFEVILVDDGSTDKSGDICDRYAKDFPSLITVVHQENRGLLCARRIAIPRSQGDFCIFVDSDDFVEPNLLAELSKTIANTPDVDLVLYSFRYFRKGRKAERFHPIAKDGKIWAVNEKRELYEKLLFTNDVSPMWIKAVRSNILKSDPTDYSPYYGRNMAEDVLQSLYILTAAPKVEYLNKPLYNYRIISNSISHTFQPESIARKSTLHVYEKCLEYLWTWSMDTEEYRMKVAASWYGRTMYEFIHCYENADDSSERRQIIEADWNALFPKIDVMKMSVHLSPVYMNLYHKLENKEYFSLYFFFLKRRFYYFCNSIKKCLKLGKRK